MIKAVITGDIINSSTYTEEERDTVYKYLAKVLRYIKKRDNTKYTIYRGDSIQGLALDVKDALWHALYIKAAMGCLKLKENQRGTAVDIRISIGLGTVDYLRPKLEESDGEAFRLSGRTLDTMKKSGHNLAITTPDESYNARWNVILQLADTVMEKWTVKSAEVVSLLLEEDNEKDVSKKLKISQPAVNSRKKHAGWDAIRNMLQLYTATADQLNEDDS